jgi:hypothetical protein
MLSDLIADHCSPMTEYRPLGDVRGPALLLGHVAGQPAQRLRIARIGPWS